MSNTVNNYTETDLGNISLNPRGEYDNSAAYEYLDTVSYQGGSYFCLAELETTITGIAPDSGRNSEHWQMIATPGDMTPEYTAAYNDVIKKAVQVETSRTAVELAQQEIEAVQTDVQQLHSDTVQAAQEAENSKDSAANYAQSAEQSRNAASESEQNVNAQITKVETDVKKVANDRLAVEAAAKNVSDNTQSVVSNAKNAKTAAENAAQSAKSVEDASKQIEQNKEDLNNILSPNLFNPKDAKENTAINQDDGTEMSFDGWLATGYIPVSKNDVLYFSSNEEPIPYSTGAFYDKNKQRVDSFGNPNNNNNITVTSDGYARFSFGTAPMNLQIEKGSRTTYVPYGELKVKVEVDNVKEDLSNKITKFYASNQGETHITDSDNGKIQDMMVYGRSEQKQYSGKNLLPTTMYGNNIVQNGITFTNNGDGSVTVSGTATDTTYFTLWGYNQLSDKGILPGLKVGETVSVSDCLLQETNSKELLKITTNGTATINSSTTTMFVGIRINKNSTVNKTYYPQIEKGSEITSYEPYTGGQPSPSPDYPQEIKSVVNPTVKVCGANIMRLNDVRENTLVGITVSCKDGVIKAKGTALQDYTIPLGRSAGFIVMESMTLQNSKTYIFNPNQINGTESSECYLDFTNVNNLGISFSNNNINNPIKPTYSQTQCPFNLNLIVKQGTVVDKEWKPQVLLNEYLLPYEPYKEQSIQLPITLNAIPVSSNGNVTIDGKQYVSDYVDVERGKLVRMVDSSKLDNTQSIVDKTEWLLAEPQETDLTTGEITAFKALTTYYPTTNISVNSEQLDGYIVFNYPISMANGWNYVKKQLNDNRDYIYDMDTRTQDTDLQAAEAYVNSEYAVALTELEV